MEKKSSRATLSHENPVHHRVESWVGLKQFLFGLPEDFSYAVKTSKKNSASVEESETHVFVRVGWKSWYGRALGRERADSLARSLAVARQTNPLWLQWIFAGVRHWRRRKRRNLYVVKHPPSGG